MACGTKKKPMKGEMHEGSKKEDKCGTKKKGK